MLRKLAFAILLLLAINSPSWATITLQQHTSAGSSDGDTVTTSAINTTTGSVNLIVIGISGNTSTLCTPTDSASNSWTGLTEYSDVRRVRVWYKQSPTTSASHTFTCTASGTLPTITVATFSGVSTSPFDQENGGSTSGLEVQVLTGSITPSQNNELIVSVLAGSDDATASVDQSMTKIEEIAASGALHVGGRMAYKVQTTATAINVTWSWSSSARGTATINSFKEDTGGGGGGTIARPLILRLGL